MGVIVPWLFRPLEKMVKSERALWTAIMFALVLLEIDSLYQDRNEHENEQAQARCEQTEKFGAIAQGIKNAITESDTQFGKTTVELNKNLEAVGVAIQQTRPRANVLVLGFDIENPPTVPLPFQTGITYDFDIQVANDGSETAKILRRLAQITIGKPDDLETQKRLAGAFEKVWARTPRADNYHDLVKQAPQYWTEERPFSEDEVREMNEKHETVYVLTRFEYRDSTGTWWTDRCDHIQMNGNRIYLKVNRPCYTFSNPRYKAPHK